MSADGQDAVAEHYEEERKATYHQEMLREGRTQPGAPQTTQVLKELSEIDDLPLKPEDDEVMGQLISKLTSTANLTAEEVRSNEWVREYILILYLCQFPTPDGCHGSWREWAHGDSDAGREPLDPRKRLQLETLVTTSKLALTRSEDAKVIEEGTRDVKETHVHDGEGEGGGGGIRGLLGLG